VKQKSIVAPFVLPPTTAIALAAKLLRDSRTQQERTELVDMILQCVDVIEQQGVNAELRVVSHKKNAGGAV